MATFCLTESEAESERSCDPENFLTPIFETHTRKPWQHNIFKF